MDIGTVLELLSDREAPDLEEGLFNPMVTNLEGVYVAESFEKYLFRKAFHMYMRGLTYREFTSSPVCRHHEKNRIENCRTCAYCGDTVEERMDFIHRMAEAYGLKKAWFSDRAHFICYHANYAFEIDVCQGYSASFSCNDEELWKQVRYRIGLFPDFFACLSLFENEKDGEDEKDRKDEKDDDDMYERHASFNRYGDLSKLITDPDLLQSVSIG